MNIGNVNGNYLAEEEVDNKMMDSSEKNLKIRAAAATFSRLKSHKMFVCMYVMFAFCILQIQTPWCIIMTASLYGDTIVTVSDISYRESPCDSNP